VRIIQITDLHIHHVDEVVNGVNTKNNFINILKIVAKMDYDLLVITGDLSFFDGNKQVYIWIKQQLEKYNINNYHVIGGNHDNAAIMAKVFEKKQDLNGDELYYFIEPNFIFLDTIKGYCNSRQMDWFKAKMKEIEGIEPIVFMHHPPFKSGVPHMDSKYAFQQPEEFENICKLHSKKIFVFCGHYHNEISIVIDKINMFITPSAYVQIDMFNEEFEVYHTVPAFRIIDIDDSQLKTTVRYVFD